MLSSFSAVFDHHLTNKSGAAAGSSSIFCADLAIFFFFSDAAALLPEEITHWLIVLFTCFIYLFLYLGCIFSLISLDYFQSVFVNRRFDDQPAPHARVCLAQFNRLITQGCKYIGVQVGVFFA